MAGRRPHLVHEGSSILDENDHPLHDADGFSSTSSQLLIHDHDDNSTREKQQHLGTVGGSSLHRAVGGSKVITTSHKTKLQTKFIVGHAASSLKLLDFDESMMSLPGEDNEIDPPPEKSLRPMTADEAVFPTRTNNYKLRTRLVVGVNQCDDDLDENMIMDEDGAGEQQQLIIQFNKVRCSSNNTIHNESMSSIVFMHVLCYLGVYVFLLSIFLFVNVFVCILLNLFCYMFSVGVCYMLFVLYC
jgi:hypothetical protein